MLGLLHKKSIKNGDHEDFWKKRLALSSASIGKALFKENIILAIRREIRKQEGLFIDEEDLAKSIHEMFIPEVREQLGPVKIRRKRKIIRKEEKTKIIVSPNS